MDVFLNFSKREVALDLHAYAGRSCYCTRRGAHGPVPNVRTLGAWEAMVIFDAETPQKHEGPGVSSEAFAVSLDG